MNGRIGFTTLGGIRGWAAKFYNVLSLREVIYPIQAICKLNVLYFFIAVVGTSM